jgi:hypothetical protein
MYSFIAVVFFQISLIEMFIYIHAYAYSEILQTMEFFNLHIFFLVLKGPASEVATDAIVDIQHEGRAREDKYSTISGWIAAKEKNIDKTNANVFPINTKTTISSSNSSNNNGVHSNDTGVMNINSDEGSDTTTTSTVADETSHSAFEYDGGLTEPTTSLLIDINDNNTSNHNGLKKRILLRPYEGVASRKKGLNSEGQGRPLQSPQETETKEVDPNEIDLYLNTCGPIWDIAFAPNSKTDNTSKSDACSSTYSSTSPSTAILEKHLAVATSRIGWPQQPSSSSSSGKSSMIMLMHEPNIFMI